MDEATLTSVLRTLAAESRLHPSPSADARRMAARLRRRRRGAATGVVAVVALGVLGGVRLSSDSSRGQAAGPAAAENWQVGLRESGNPNHQTVVPVAMPRDAGSQFAVYWQDRKPCWIEIGDDRSSAGSECFAPVTAAPGPVVVTGTLAVPDGALVAVAPGVKVLRVSFSDGHHRDVKPVTGPGFPYAEAVVLGRVTAVRGLDANGKQVGDAVPGPASLQLRQVTQAGQCPLQVAGAAVPDTTGSRCYLLDKPAVALVPASVDVLKDETMGWIVQITFNAKDTRTFGLLTQRLTTAEAPRNQLAFVLNDKVINAPTIQSAISGGVAQLFAGSDNPWTETYARQLAAQLGG